MALSLIHVHCKDAKQDKLKALQVGKTKKLQFEDFMEMFMVAATWIVEEFDLDTFVEAVESSASQ